MGSLIDDELADARRGSSERPQLLPSLVWCLGTDFSVPIKGACAAGLGSGDSGVSKAGGRVGN